MKIAVAGATGRVGRPLVDVLQARGHNVMAMSRSTGVDVITGEGLARALRGRLESWLKIDLRARFRDRILPVDESIAERWGALSAIAAAKGKPAPIIDGLLAATAVHHDLMLVTRNIQDVAGTGVPTLNPWS